MSPPQRLVVLGDDIVGLVLVNLCEEGHLIQKVVHLSHEGKRKLRGETIYIRKPLCESLCRIYEIYLFNSGLV